MGKFGQVQHWSVGDLYFKWGYVFNKEKKIGTQGSTLPGAQGHMPLDFAVGS